MTARDSHGCRNGLHADVFLGLLLLVLCGIGFWLTTGFDAVSPMLSQNVPPTFFPRLVLGTIAVLSIVLIARGFKLKRKPTEKPAAAVYVTAAVIVIATLLVERLGTMPTLFLLAALLPPLWGERRYGLVALVAIGLPVAVYLVFTLALDVRFPTGIVKQLLF